eukprot:CAMPEP_0196579332 /NCGR_PEP_ID=MMETSP1081-20130531/20340_1 /TAXON_ID=36882 /ORGANISM="Pyramimonas amylifera, Strain CCMP720" /LENGTH=123 /DNA_ID=CAMNT_0041898877 /DNA_START=159 /DNA_END=526 /DNA_ORIENTATION=+
MGADNNCRVYFSGFPDDITEDDVRELFCGIGIIARQRQKRGFKDQWPWAIKLYKEDNGKMKGDGTVTYEDPSAAQSAPEFFNGHVFRGKTIEVQMATMSENRYPDGGDGRGGGGGRGGFGGRG